MIEAQTGFARPSAAVARRLRNRLGPQVRAGRGLLARVPRDDLRLFGLTFAAGFLFFSVFLA
ncbi:hypothetical protein SAMN06295912_10553 [Sphingomonas laterariae]|uniref:Uncharacterized protein n=1 Tax=Edaphosphingomonas laterariae TaxID=861865 RepID=A0A239DUJ5_9SPHN|nr:hypothetical protein [Sphingomonas laterariae]SNS36150.1 hypothetical protein SAMN06295912_10553 [Sphingomonas laterariae]